MTDAQDGVLFKREQDSQAVDTNEVMTEFEFRQSGNDISIRLKGPLSWVDEIVNRVNPFSAVKFGDHPTILLGTDDDPPGDGDFNISPEAKKLLEQAGFDLESLQDVFHFDDGSFKVIVPDLPGSSNRQKVGNAYLLQGFADFLLTGSAKFSDEDARGLCRNYGVYDPPNHSNSLKELKQEMIGSKAGGWTLTMPGKSRALKVVSEAAGATIA